MATQKTNKMQEAYCLVLGDQIEKLVAGVSGRGIGAVTNTIGDIVTRLGSTDSGSKFFSIVTPMWGLVASLISTLIDELVMHSGACKVIEATELDEGMKKSLYLCFRSTALTSINGKRGHMIETKELLEAVPALSDLPLEQQQAIVRGLRDIHQKYLRNEVPAEEEVFFQSFVKALRACDLDEVENVLLKEMKRLHERIVETRQ